MTPTTALDAARLLESTGSTLSLAESCTGGLLSSMLTSVPGASDWFLGSVVSYAPSVKTSLLGVPAALIDTEGVVSEKVAAAMADGVRRLTGSDLAGAVTGYAGPSGGSPGRPVGTVCLAMAWEGGGTTLTVHLKGDREMVRRGAAGYLLGMIAGRLEERES